MDRRTMMNSVNHVNRRPVERTDVTPNSPSPAHLNNASGDSVKIPEHNVDTKQINSYICSYCGYTAKRKYTLKVHVKQHCSGITYSNEIKDKTCGFCKRHYTHDGLRSHLRGYINALNKNLKIRGNHRMYDIGQHQRYLKEIKLREI